MLMEWLKDGGKGRRMKGTVSLMEVEKNDEWWRETRETGVWRNCSFLTTFLLPFLSSLFILSALLFCFFLFCFPHPLSVSVIVFPSASSLALTSPLHSSPLLSFFTTHFFLSYDCLIFRSFFSSYFPPRCSVVISVLLSFHPSLISSAIIALFSSSPYHSPSSFHHNLNSTKAAVHIGQHVKKTHSCFLRKGPAASRSCPIKTKEKR